MARSHGTRGTGNSRGYACRNFSIVADSILFIKSDSYSTGFTRRRTKLFFAEVLHFVLVKAGQHLLRSLTFPSHDRPDPRFSFSSQV